MKIGDQKPPVPPKAGDGVGVEATESPDRARDSGFAERLDGAGPAGAPEGPDARPVDDIEALAQRVERGELSADEAVRLVVDRILDQQLGPDASPELRQRARKLIAKALEENPHLSSLVKRLGEP